MAHVRNELTNGRFIHDLDDWTVSGATYRASDGDDHFGMAELSAGGDYIEQDFAVAHARAFTLHTAIKSVGGTVSGTDVEVDITDGDGNAVTTIQLSTSSAGEWTEATNVIGLAPGTTYTLRITNNSGLTVRVDDVWLWALAITRSSAADIINRKLGRLASNRSLSTSASGSQTEGDYTDAIDASLRDLGAIDPETGDPDIRYIDHEDAEEFLDVVEHNMLERLHRDYAADVDASFAGQSLSRSQRAGAIRELLEDRGSDSTRRPKMGKLTHR